MSIAYNTVKFRSLLPKFRPKNTVQRRNPLETNNCVYKYSCGCGLVYIGETLRRLDIRTAEHSRNTQKSRSPMMSHIQECGSKFSALNFSVVAAGLKGISARKKYETIFIEHFSKFRKCMNICEKSKSLSVF